MDWVALLSGYPPPLPLRNNKVAKLALFNLTTPNIIFIFEFCQGILLSFRHNQNHYRYLVKAKGLVTGSDGSGLITCVRYKQGTNSERFVDNVHCSIVPLVLYVPYLAVRHHMNFSTLDQMQDVVYKIKRYRFQVRYIVGFMCRRPACRKVVSRFESPPGPGGILIGKQGWNGLTTLPLGSESVTALPSWRMWSV